ncbi:4Fe-4S binding protein [Dehalobacter sp. 4CP]|uniref:4Fe-4S binding protein n=1 Tax=Dehalobacter sp. CP TaxID=2594474 RepID=UPI0039EA7F60
MASKKRDLESCYLIVLFITAIAAIFYGIFWTSKTIDYEAVIQQNVPGVTSIEKIIGTQRAYQVDAAGEKYYAVCDSAVGYQSRIEAMTIVNQEGFVEEVMITQQGETPIFFERLYTGKLFDQFKNLSVKEPIYLGGASGYSGYLDQRQTNNYIDRVTGSTVSSHAVAEAVNKGTAYVASQFFHTRWSNPYDTYQFNRQDFAMIMIYIIALAAALIKKLVRLRVWILLAAFGVMGFFVKEFVAASNLFSLITLQIPGLTNVGWYVLIVGSLGFIVLLGKNIYCAWICPFGAAQEVINKAAGFKSLGISPQVTKKLKLAAPTILWVAIMLGTFLGDYGTLDYQPFSAFFLFKAVWVMWLMLPVFIFISLFISRFYCQFFCPVGFILNLLNRWRNNGVKVWKQMWNRIWNQRWNQWKSDKA